jgi:hypothetical protein
MGDRVPSWACITALVTEFVLHGSHPVTQPQQVHLPDEVGYPTAVVALSTGPGITGSTASVQGSSLPFFQGMNPWNGDRGVY